MYEPLFFSLAYSLPRCLRWLYTARISTPISFIARGNRAVPGLVVVLRAAGVSLAGALRASPQREQIEGSRKRDLLLVHCGF